VAVFWFFLSSLDNSTTVIAGAGLPNHMMAINGRGFLGPKKKTIESLLAFNPLWSYAKRVYSVSACTNNIVISMGLLEC
jgi:hypothetical protein